MLSPNEDSGIFTYLFGLIVLVMVGVGLSLLIDKRSEFSSGAGIIQREIKLVDEEIVELKNEYKRLSLQLQNCEPKLRLSLQNFQKLSSESEIQQKQKAELEHLHRKVSADITSLEQKVSQVRSDYQRETRAAAVGENLGNLSVRGGRVYNRATILQVTDVGLEIRHEHGFARLHGPELDAKLQERFEWDEEKRQKCLDKENENQDRDIEKPAEIRATISPDTQPLAQKDAMPSSANDQSIVLDVLQKRVSDWKQKVSTLRMGKAQADYQANNGKSHSIPGSLETWEAKAGRLGQDLTKARGCLELAKAQLAEIAPTDLLLLPEEED